MLKLMPIPHVFHMKEIIPMSRKTNDCCGDMFTGGPDVLNNHAKCSKPAYAIFPPHQLKNGNFRTEFC